MWQVSAAETVAVAQTLPPRPRNPRVGSHTHYVLGTFNPRSQRPNVGGRQGICGRSECSEWMERRVGFPSRFDRIT